MNQQSANSSFTTEPSTLSNVSAHVTSDKAAGRCPHGGSANQNQAQASIPGPGKGPQTNAGQRRQPLPPLHLQRPPLPPHRSGSPASGLCFRHLGREFQPADEDLSSAFAGQLSGFRSALDIHIFLAQLTILLVQNHVSTRRAAVLTYLAQTLLRTIPASKTNSTPMSKTPNGSSTSHAPSATEAIHVHRQTL